MVSEKIRRSGIRSAAPPRRVCPIRSRIHGPGRNPQHLKPSARADCQSTRKYGKHVRKSQPENAAGRRRGTAGERGSAVARLIVQIYEIQTPQEAEAVASAGVDHVGSVVVSEENWKTAELKAAIDRVRACGARSSLIPLFQAGSGVLRTLEFYRPDIVHFCDALPPSALSGPGLDPVCERLIELQIRVKKRFPEMAVMRSIPIAPPGDAHRVPTLEYGRVFEPWTDFFLTDTLLVGPTPADDQRQPVSGFVGITGQTCDWGMAGRLVRQSRIPVILAGGIAPENAAEAVTRTRPAGVDSCTRTNACDAQGRPIRFRKDLEKVRALVAAVRRAESFL